MANVASIEVNRIRGYSRLCALTRLWREGGGRRFEMPVNSRWWRHKIWNALRKWQGWGRRHKQTHKSAIDRHIDDGGDRQAPSAIAISLHLLSLSLAPSLSHNLNPHFLGIALSPLCTPESSIFSFRLQCPGWTGSHSPSPSSPSPVFQPREKVFAPSLPLSGCVLAAL